MDRSTPTRTAAFHASSASSITVASPRRIRTRWVTRSINRRVSIGAPDPLTSAMPSSQWCSAARSSRFNHAACERYHSASARSAASAVCSTPAAMASAAAGWLTAMSAAAASRRSAHTGCITTCLDGHRQQPRGLCRGGGRRCPLGQIGGRRALAGSEEVPGRVDVVAHEREAGVDRPPRGVVDQVDDGVAEQGVRQDDAVGLFAHQGRSRLEHVAGACRSEQVTGERPAVQRHHGELLDGHRRQRRHTGAHGVHQRRRHGVAADELLEEQRTAAGQLDELRPRLRVEGRMELVGERQRGRRGERAHVDDGHPRVALDRQWAPARHDEWNVTGEQLEHLQRAVVAPVGVLDDQDVVAELGGDVGGDVGGRALQRAAEGVRQRVVGELAQLLERLGRRRGCATAGRVARGSTCRSPPARARARSHLRRAATMTRPGAPPKRAHGVNGSGAWNAIVTSGVPRLAGSGEAPPACDAYRQPPMGRCRRTPI